MFVLQSYGQDQRYELDFDPVTNEFIVRMDIANDVAFFSMGASQVSLITCGDYGINAISITNSSISGNAYSINTSESDGIGLDYYGIATTGGGWTNQAVTTGQQFDLFRFTIAGFPDAGGCSTYSSCTATSGSDFPVRLFINGTDDTTGGVAGNDFDNTLTHAFDSDALLPGAAGSVNDPINSCPLPVELLAFNATPNRNAIALNWATATETNNSGFEIQRSTKPRSNFEKIAWVDGAGNSATRMDYDFLDEEVRTGVEYYYQLKQIDLDGSFEYSEVKSAKLNSGGIDAEVRPNPAKQAVEIAVGSTIKGDLILSLIDIQGRTISTKTYNGNNTINLDVSNLPAGMYMVRIENNSKSIVKKLIVE